MRWHSVMCAMSGITATAWTFPVRCLVSLRSTGSVRDVYMSNEQLVSDACYSLHFIESVLTSIVPRCY